MANPNRGASAATTGDLLQQHNEQQQSCVHPFAHCVALLQSISPVDARPLTHTREYREFLKAVERLESAHRQISQWNDANRMMSSVVAADDSLDAEVATSFASFLQHTASDDIVTRVFSFLDCRDLVQAMMTCSRFRELAEQHATERTRAMARGRQLATKMQLLRAQEQIEGIAGTGISDRHVPVPALLPSRRILISQAGDPEYNGVYFCTGSNGNGFVFTKPRSPEQRVTTNNNNESSSSSSDRRSHHRSMHADVALFDSAAESEVAQPGQLLRCIIAKRFSNETILWYLSKEVIAADEDDGDVRAGDLIQLFSFWAKLMVIGDASPDICRYPSQTSILTRHEPRDGGWQNLSTTRTVQPPIVELLD